MTKTTHQPSVLFTLKVKTWTYLTWNFSSYSNVSNNMLWKCSQLRMHQQSIKRKFLFVIMQSILC